MKQGYPLREISGFDTRVLSTLRDHLSVTTAEEFLHAAATYPDAIAGLLSTDRVVVARYAEAAAAALGHDEADAILNPPAVPYAFRTGHDAPPSSGPRRRV
jgi:hypothetical protein